MSDAGPHVADTPTSDPTEPKAAVWEDFVDIFFTPRKVFERRKGWSAWPVLLVLTAVIVLLFLSWQQVLGPVLDQEMQRATAEAMDGAEMDAAQIDQMRSMSRIFGAVGVALSFPASILVIALVTWGLARMFGAAATFATVLGVATYSQVVRLLQYLAGLIQGFILDVDAMDSIHDVGIGPVRFLDQPDASGLAVALAARFDLFTLWATALIAIGLAAVTRLDRGRAWAVAILVWLLAAVPAVVGALLGGR